MKPAILVLQPAPPGAALDALRSRFMLHGPFDDDALAAFLGSRGAEVEGIAATGKAALTAALLDKLPRLRIVSCYSAGTDGFDMAALAARGIAVANTGVALADDVADLAIALLLMARRRLVAADAHARSGAWVRSEFPLGQPVAGRRLGLLGFGNIGQAIARRGEAMRMRPRYCARSAKPGTPYPFHPTPLGLARDSDVLVVACPGGGANRHLVTTPVLDALGPHGTLVNIARGEIVDQDALVAALAAGRLGSAGLDVLDGEPDVPPALATLPNVVLTPHIGSATADTRAAMGQAMVDALDRAFAGVAKPSPA